MIVVSPRKVIQVLFVLIGACWAAMIEYSDSYQCRSKCIDKGYVFCPKDSAKNTGTCCQTEEDIADCPRADICSDNAVEGSPHTLVDYVCPNESHCGNSAEQTPDFDGSTIYVRSVVNSNRFDNFVTGDVCGFKILYPPEALPGDEVVIKMTKLLKANAYISVGETFEVANKTEKFSSGETITLTVPEMAWITIYG